MPRIKTDQKKKIKGIKARRTKQTTFFDVKKLLRVMGASFFALSILWLFLSQTPKKLIQIAKAELHALSQAGDFNLNEIQIAGHFYTKKEKILEACRAHYGESIFKYDPEMIQKKLKQLPWVRSVKVQRVLPNRLKIKIAEKFPIALWQKDKKLTLVDDQGELIRPANVEKFSYLPIVIGEKAAEEAPHLFAVLTSQPHLQKRLSAAILVSKRRWDLILDQKIKVKLPEKNISKSLVYLAKIEKDKSIDMGDVVSIDLRVPDRLYVHLKHKAAVTRRSVGRREKV